ncbi:ankyrin repeat domain-containing protein [Legionella sp. D16C41]|uniref:ankyrin repeat domain-containing protein n=1 Tax=Legionella sp. D16C41 TaxID=3402688 RepID=UPI003AF8E884
MKIADQISDTKKIFFDAIKEGNTFLFKALLEALLKEFKIEEIIDSTFGANALHWAADNGHLEIVQFLVEKFPKLIDVTAADNATPILYAIINGHTEVVRYLVQQNACLTITAKSNKNPLTAAEEKPEGHPIRTYLKEYQNILNANFAKAITSEDHMLAATWLDKGADIETPIRYAHDDNIKYTALFHACSTGNIDLARMLIARKANLNIIGARNGFTPLHAAVLFNHQPIVQLLQNSGARFIKDKSNQTPLELAQSRNMQHMVAILKDKYELNNVSQEKNKPNSLTATNTATLDKLKNEFTQLTSFTTVKNNTIDELQQRLNNLKPKMTTSSHIANSIFKQEGRKAVEVKLLREQIDLMSQHVKNMSIAGKECIEGYNSKCPHEDMKVNYNEFNQDVEKLQKLVSKLQEIFSKDIEEITSIIKENHLVHNKVSSIKNIPSNNYHSLYNKIIPSQEYGKAYSTLFSEMTAIEQLAEKFGKQITKISDNKMELMAEAKNNLEYV